MNYHYDVEGYDYAWLNLTKKDIKGLVNPMSDLNSWQQDNFHLYVLQLMSNPKYFHWTVKHLLNIDLLPSQVVILQELWTHAFPMYLASRGYGKSFLLAVYAMLRCLFIPETKIIVVGAAFRQSKVIFEYMATLWKNAPIYQSVCGGNSGPSRDIDRCTMRINDSWTIAVPLGSGEKIRGLRAHTILCDEFNSVPIEIYETVVEGFAAVSKDPSENVKEAAKRRKMKADGVWSERQETSWQGRHKNQSIISGTAGYDFEPYADYWRKYKATIKCEGDLSKINTDYRDEDGELPEYMTKINYKEFSIIRIPYELIPEGFMSDEIISRARATMHTGTFNMEYGACGCYDTPIITTKGIKELGEILIGDLVLTHKGRFRKVIRRTYRNYKGSIINLKSYGYYKSLLFTPEHPFWENKNDFINLENLKLLSLSPVKELSKKKELYTTQICTNFVDREDFLYPQSSQTKINNKNRKLILQHLKEKSLTQKELVNKFGICQAAISQIKNEKRRPKNSIPQSIKLDYNFGLIIGYYAAEGSVGANGRQVEFALDGHVDKSLEFFVDQLSNSIEKSLGIIPKIYEKQDNTLTVDINSRVFCEVIKHICPGDCYSKLIKHDILFSNSEFLKGFIVGMWNGDGHINDKFATLQLTNKNLVNQVKMALSFFGVSCSFLSPKRNKTGFIKGKKVNFARAWKINISGYEFRKFLNIFYDKKTPKYTNRDKISYKDGVCMFEISSKSIEEYDGLVYNLEVEEDNSYSLPNATVHNCFSKDSQGFYKRTLIESIVANDRNLKLSTWAEWCPAVFDVATRGKSDRQYVFGIDPASEIDNFAITIQELYPQHQRLVYVWTTNKKDFQQRKRLGLTDIDDYYSFCVRKIRDLMQLFPCIRIGIDSQGGGYQIAEGLRDRDKIRLELGEQPIYPVIEDGKEQETDHLVGQHILELVNFASAEWTSNANHGLRKDMEDKAVLFPRFDQMTLGLVSAQDEIYFKDLKKKIGDSSALKVYDTLEDCIMNIEELKAELSTIVVSRTASGREKFDTPEVKIGVGKKGRLRKDRYSALLISNSIARTILRELPSLQYDQIGRVALYPVAKKEHDGRMYMGHGWEDFKPTSVKVIRRNN